jgi:hypothetical protein
MCVCTYILCTYVCILEGAEEKTNEITGSGENYIMRSLMISTAHRMLLGDKMRRMRWTGQVARMGRGEANTGFWWGNLRERDRLEDPEVDGGITLNWTFSKWNVGAWTGLICLRIGTGCVLLSVR